jgi:acetyltransferase
LYNPKASIEGVLIEETVQDAIEAFVGLKWSEKFGSLVMFGLGGIFVEIFRDVSLRLAPVNEAEAGEMIEELKAKSLFYGFRQFAERDVEATVRAIVIISELGATLGSDLMELDVNPLFVLRKGNGVKAGDALIRLRRLTLFGRSS